MGDSPRARAAFQHCDTGDSFSRHSMRPETMTQSARARNTALISCLLLSAASLGVVSALSAQAAKPAQNAPDLRVGLAAGWMDAKEAARNLELVAHAPKPPGWFDATRPGDFP